MLLATELLESPAPMFNHHRGLWGYCGPAADGSGRLVIQGTGVGGPSINAVVSDLALLGVSRMVRLGTACSPRLPLWATVVASAASAPSGAESAPDAQMLSNSSEVFEKTTIGAVTSAEVHLTPSEVLEPAIAADLSTATLYSTASRLGAAALAVLVVTETADGTASDEDLEAAMKAIAPSALKLLR